jgi:hypothetical protein
VQGFEHRPIATKDDDHISVFRRDCPELLAKTLAGALCCYAIGSHESYFIEGHDLPPNDFEPEKGAREYYGMAAGPAIR